MVPSQLPLARVRPSGEKATDVTTLLWLAWRPVRGFDSIVSIMSLQSSIPGKSPERCVDAQQGPSPRAANARIAFAPSVALATEGFIERLMITAMTNLRRGSTEVCRQTRDPISDRGATGRRTTLNSDLNSRISRFQNNLRRITRSDGGV